MTQMTRSSGLIRPLTRHRAADHAGVVLGGRDPAGTGPEPVGAGGQLSCTSNLSPLHAARQVPDLRPAGGGGRSGLGLLRHPVSLGHGAFFALGGYAMGMYLMRQIGDRGVYGDPVCPTSWCS
jgi:hypothetical protein